MNVIVNPCVMEFSAQILLIFYAVISVVFLLLKKNDKINNLSGIELDH